MSEENTGRIVRYTYDPANPPRLTVEETQHLETMKDEDIDLSDIPDQSGLGSWRRPGRIHNGIASNSASESNLVRLEPDVLSFFRTGGDADEHRINQALREYIKTCQ